jgi:hypothetical protein
MGQDDKQPAKEAGMKDASAVSTGADVRVVRPQRQATQVAVRSHSGSKILGTFGKNKGKESETAERVKGTRAPVATKTGDEDTGRLEEGRCCLWEMFMFTVLNPVLIKTPLAS